MRQDSFGKTKGEWGSGGMGQWGNEAVGEWGKIHLEKQRGNEAREPAEQREPGSNSISTRFSFENIFKNFLEKVLYWKLFAKGFQFGKVAGRLYFILLFTFGRPSVSLVFRNLSIHKPLVPTAQPDRMLLHFKAPVEQNEVPLIPGEFHSVSMSYRVIEL